MQEPLTIGEMIALTPPKQKRTFERPIGPTETRSRFVAIVHDLHRPLVRAREYEPVRIPTRLVNGSKSFHDVRFECRFDELAEQIEDFYSYDRSVFLISNRLLKLMLKFDTEPVARRSVTVEAKDRHVPFWAVTPTRVMEAIDTARTTVTIEQDWIIPIAHVYFPKGFLFREDIDERVHSFWEIDKGSWFWSRILVDAARGAGIRGFYVQDYTSNALGDVTFLNSSG